VGIGDTYKIPGCDYVWDKPLKEVEELVQRVGEFLAIDNFLHHLAHSIGVRGTVIYGPSDPRLFGYSDQINIIKDFKYLRKSLVRDDGWTDGGQYGYYRDYVWEHAQEGWYNAEELFEPEELFELSGLGGGEKKDVGLNPGSKETRVCPVESA
jgi:hypothetical protein